MSRYGISAVAAGIDLPDGSNVGQIESKRLTGGAEVRQAPSFITARLNIQGPRFETETAEPCQQLLGQDRPGCNEPNDQLTPQIALRALNKAELSQRIVNVSRLARSVNSS